MARAQLASVLADTTKELEAIKQDLAHAKRRGDQYKSLADSYKCVTGAPEEAVQTRVRSLEQRVRDAELQRDTEVARRAAITDLWTQFRQYLEHIEYQVRDARHAFDKVIENGGGVFQLPRVPTLNEISPPPRTYTIDGNGSRHAYKQQLQQPGRPSSSSSFPQLPPHPSSSRIRPRSDSLDAGAYTNNKRSKTDKGYVTAQHALYAPNHPQQGHPHPPPRHHYADQPYSRPGPRSRSRSASNASSVSMDIDDLLIAASSNGQQHQQTQPAPPPDQSGRRQYQYPFPNQNPSPPTRYPENAYPGGGSYNGPPSSQQQPQQQQQQPQQQTHVFVPVMNGNTVNKKGRLGPESTLGTFLISIIVCTLSNRFIVDPIPPPQPASTYPAHNAAGERLCRQCGMVGRYKDGKCVEKWGPGPMGPGTVCDRSVASFVISPPRTRADECVCFLFQMPKEDEARGAQRHA